MAVKNVAQSIRAGEISLGVAVGVESMSLKSVPFVPKFATRLDASRRVSVVLRVSSVSHDFRFICTVPALPL